MSIILHMKSISVQLKILKQLFPLKEAEIEALYEQDETFRELCNDYTSCLDYMNKVLNDFDENKHTLSEIEQLKTELENDLKIYLK